MQTIKLFPIIMFTAVLACSNSGSDREGSTDPVKNADGSVAAISPSGVVYVGNRNGDKVYAVQDTDGDFKADKKWTIASGLNSPNGVAFKDGDLYIAEISRITKFQGIESKLSNPGKPVVVTDDY